VDTDPESLRQRVEEATAPLAVAAAMLSDTQAREPSLLPGWSRGHLLTHLARNADGLRNLLVWARTGVATPQYPSWDAREAAIEEGSGRSAAELAADLEQAAAGFADEAASLPAAAWDRLVRGFTGPEHPAWYTLFRRLIEVEFHHVDLGSGYAPPDWPARFVADELEGVIRQFAARDDVPACVLEVTGTGQRLLLGPVAAAGAQTPVTVAGPGCWLLAWLTGRDAGTRLSVSAPPDGPEPADGTREPAGSQRRLPPKLPKWM
jgi:maleylpyruvate isomerase